MSFLAKSSSSTPFATSVRGRKFRGARTSNQRKAVLLLQIDDFHAALKGLMNKRIVILQTRKQQTYWWGAISLKLVSTRLRATGERQDKYI
jgi:hypothetical protein